MVPWYQASLLEHNNEYIQWAKALLWSQYVFAYNTDKAGVTEAWGKWLKDMENVSV